LKNISRAHCATVPLPPLVYKVHPRDNVGTALAPLSEGVEYPVYEEGRGVVGTIVPLTPVPKWHKVALERIEEGEEVVKFGLTIGVSVCSIDRGLVVHLTNVILDPSFDLREALRRGFVLGEATARIERGDAVRAGVNARLTHPLFRQLPPRTRIGFAATAVPEGGALRLGNIVEPPPAIRVSERYVALVRNFYRFLRAGFIDFARVQV